MIVVLTTAIVPHCEVKITSPTVRLAQVLAAISMWKASGLVDHLIVADASGVEREIPGVSWYGFDLREISAVKGKGHAEATLLERVIEADPILRDSTGFLKCTGRLFMHNFDEVLSGLFMHECFMGWGPTPGEMDTRAFWCQTDFFRKILAKATPTIDDAQHRTYIEQVYGGLLALGKQFPARPLFTGRGATTDLKYDVDYPALPIKTAKLMLPKNDVQIFCVYHNDLILDFEKLGYLKPDQEGVTFVKVRQSGFTYKCDRHMDLYAQDWHRPCDPGFAEYEFMRSLYYAEKGGEIELPEYVGFTQYDMDHRTIDLQTPLDQSSVIMLQGHRIRDILHQGVTVEGHDLVRTLLTINKVNPEDGDRFLPMCSAVILHRDVFMSAMALVVRSMEDPTSLINSRSKLDPRFCGGMAERYFATIITGMNLHMIHSEIEHSGYQSNSRIVVPEPQKGMGHNAGVIERPYGYLTTERFVDQKKWHVIVRRYGHDGKHLGNVGILRNMEDVRLFNYKGSVLGFGTVVTDHISVGVTRINEADGIGRVVELRGDFPMSDCEKNWVLFEHNGELLAAYALIPHLILQVDLESGLCKKYVTSVATDWIWPYGEIRGGSNVVRVGDHYLGMFHSMLMGAEYERMAPMAPHKCGKHYFTGWYLFEAKAPFKIVAASREPFELPNAHDSKWIDCCFPMSLSNDGDLFDIWYGENDLRSRMATITWARIKESLRPTATARTPLGVIRAA
jgi:hypothetical protein